jgi:hypothetical protein
MADYLRLARAARERFKTATSGEPIRINELYEVSPEKLAAFAPAIAEFGKAGFKIVRVRDGRVAPGGISMEQWRMQQITRQCDEYLKSLPLKPGLASKPERGNHPFTETGQIELSMEVAESNGNPDCEADD